MSIEIRREELAWAAGFFDGEGCVNYCETNRHHRTPLVSLNVTNTFVPALERFQSAVGGLGRIYVQRTAAQKPHWKQRFQWRVGSFEHAQAVIAMLWTFLSDQKRADAVRVLRAYHDRRRERAS